ncbi:MAG: menaquinone biosynthesis protein [Bacteroidales bacterium]|nr:menaquinone biosynthesis protein [Bacteroidales bacterium]
MEQPYPVYRVSAVSYANTLPFVYGLRHAPGRPEIELSIDIPSECAMRLKSKEADIGLVPVAALPSMEYYEIIPGYCLGADGPVRSVMLFSSVPAEKIQKIYLDPQSRTSNNLVRILARDFWHISPAWEMAPDDDSYLTVEEGGGRVLIGDRAFYAESAYPWHYDLAAMWKEFTSLPFVFAVWAANTRVHPLFVQKFNSALQYGIMHIPEAAASLHNERLHKTINLENYLLSNLSYPLDNAKMAAIKMFLDMLRSLQ